MKEKNCVHIFKVLISVDDLQLLFYSGALPLRGSIPDMTADSGRYIQLQNAYIEQANKDMAVITDKVNMLINSLAKVTF